MLKVLVSALVGLAVTASVAQAETRVTFKSAKSASSYYQMAVQIAEAVKTGTKGGIIVTVEESQGSVQNVMEAAVRPGNYVFTTPPALVSSAQSASGPFKDKGNPKFDEIRALFPIPSLTMHFVVRADSGINGFADLEGKSILLGKGSFGAKEGEKYLQLFGLEGKVTIADAELQNAAAALKNKQIDGFVTAGSFPAPNVIEAAAATGVNILSLSDEQVAATGRTRLVIPAGTYAGIDREIVTTSLPVITYGTTAMDDETAYQLTRAFWSQKKSMSASAPWWNGVTADLLGNVTTKLHPGAARYYAEAGIAVPEAIR